MSYVGAIPIDSSVAHSGAVSESHLPIIDAALASVRKNAGLDEEKVLPPLEVLAPKSPPLRVLMPDARSMPSAEAIVRSTAVSARSTGSAPIAVADRNKQTAPGIRKRTLAQRMRWPVLLCGLVAGVFGGAAVMKSPVGQRPAVRSVVTKAQSSVGKIFFAAKTRR